MADNDALQPVLYTCKNGENAGRQYYAVKRADGSFSFFRWVSSDIQMNLESRLQQLEMAANMIRKEIESLRESMKTGSDEKSHTLPPQQS